MLCLGLVVMMVTVACTCSFLRCAANRPGVVQLNPELSALDLKALLHWEHQGNVKAMVSAPATSGINRHQQSHKSYLSQAQQPQQTNTTTASMTKQKYSVNSILTTGTTSSTVNHVASSWFPNHVPGCQESVVKLQGPMVLAHDRRLL